MTIIKIQEEFKVTDVQYGIVNTSFLVSYALMFTIGGRLMDRFGSKKGLAVAVGIWSVANTLHGARARKTVVGIAAAITLVAPFITFVSTAEFAVELMAVIMFGHGFWITNYITSISDIFGAIGTSTVVGLSGTAGAISGLIINPLLLKT